MLTSGRHLLQQALKAAFGQKADKPDLIPSKMGRYNLTGAQEIQVPGHPDFVWIRLRGQDSELVRAFNDTAGLNFGDAVYVYRDALDPRYYRIYRRDTALWQDPANTSGGNFGVKPHGHSHSFGDPQLGNGSDPVFVFKRQMSQPLLCRPQNTPDMTTYVEPDFYFWNNKFVYFYGGSSPSLTPYLPPAGYGVFCTVYLEGASGSIKISPGINFSLVFPGDPASNIPFIFPSQGYPLAAVYLTSSTASITWTIMFDVRLLLSGGFGGSAPGVHGLNPDEGFHTGQLEADQVTVENPNAVFTSTDVESALYELYQREALFDWSHFT